MSHEVAEEKSSGAVFLGVVRGKLAEGMSLSDDACRCVMMVGIPYGNLKDTRVILKKYSCESRLESQSTSKSS